MDAPNDPDVRDGELLPKCTALKLQSELMAHRASRAVGGDKPVGADVFGMPIAMPQHRVHPVGVLREAHQFCSALHATAEFFQTIPQNFLGDVLRHHQQIRIGRVQAAEVERGYLMFLAVDVELADRQSPRDRSLDDAEAFEQFQCSCLQPKRFGTDVVVVRGVHTSHGHAAASQFRSGRQPDRACADDQNVDMLTVHDTSGKAGNT